MQITFLGATSTVTGSKFLLTHNDSRVLVDCGMFQGYKELRLRNWDKFPIDPSTIDAVVLTHAHIDHSGYIPLLVRNGFHGPIYCSEATYDLCSILLPDSGHIHEEDARRANKYGYTKHNPAKALYTIKDAEESLKQFKTVDFGFPHKLPGEMSFTLSRAGHILGASIITVTDGDKKIVFSGDLGRQEDPVMNPPAIMHDADYVVVESTYGDRLHDKGNLENRIGKIIQKTVARGGKVIIPAFAVGRAQLMLYYLHQLKEEGKIPKVPIFLDSPMAINTTSLMCRYPNDHKLSEKLCHDVCNAAFYTRTVEESKALDVSHVPAVILSASGMATGGRVLHHLKRFISDHRNTVMFTGFQAGGTRGDRILKGEKEIKIHGDMYPVKAQIEFIDGLSAHADYSEILGWLSHFKPSPRKVFITHGEPKSALSLKKKIESQLGLSARVPEYLETYDL